MRCQKEKACIAQKEQRLVVKGSTSEGETGTNVHGIPHETVGSLNHKSTRRIKGRWRASSDMCKAEDTPQRDRCTSSPDNHSGKLLQFNRGGADNTRPRQETGRHVYKHKADKEDSISDRADKSKNAWHARVSWSGISP
jgi:hypothetical protein